MSSVESPCISACALNDDGICIGCWRTVEEIAQWRELCDDAKRQIVQLAHQRAKASGNWL